MSERWVMTERKMIGGALFAIGDDAPVGHEGRPYTRKIEERIADPAPNRMLDTRGTVKRGRRVKA